MKNFALVLLSIVFAIANCFLFAYVILDLVHLFKLDFVPNMTVLQVVGFAVAWSILTLKSDKDPKDKNKGSIKDSIERNYYNLFLKLFCVLMTWGTSYIIVIIFK
jgi:hypothetical protein